MSLPYCKQGPVFVYEIVSEGRVRYVGAAKNPYARMLQHLTKTRIKKPTRVQRWMNACIRAGRSWSFRIIARFSDRNKAERYEQVRAAVAASHGAILNTNFPDSDRQRMIRGRQTRRQRQSAA